MRHIELHNMLLQRDSDGFFQLHKDKEAVEEFMKDVKSKSMPFSSIEEQVKFMIDQDY